MQEPRLPGGQAGMEENLGITQQLAVGRTILAMDRTLMAWIRTALSLNSFGFTIYKFFASFEARSAFPALRPTAPRNIGIFLLSLGTLSLGMALAQFWVTMTRRLKVSRKDVLQNPSVWLASAIWLMGAVLLLGILTRLM